LTRVCHANNVRIGSSQAGKHASMAEDACRDAAVAGAFIALFWGSHRCIRTGGVISTLCQIFVWSFLVCTRCRAECTNMRLFFCWR
jgi:hypothetical protein